MAECLLFAAAPPPVPSTQVSSLPWGGRRCRFLAAGFKCQAGDAFVAAAMLSPFPPWLAATQMRALFRSDRCLECSSPRRVTVVVALVVVKAKSAWVVGASFLRREPTFSVFCFNRRGRSELCRANSFVEGAEVSGYLDARRGRENSTVVPRIFSWLERNTCICLPQIVIQCLCVLILSCDIVKYLFFGRL